MFKKLMLKKGLKKSSAKINENLKSVFNLHKVDETLLEELEEALIISDVGIETTDKLISDLRKKKFGKEVNEKDIKQFLASEIEILLNPCAKELEIQDKKPFVILMAGVNGSGKTTSIGKIGAMLQKQGKSVMFAAGDTFRAAAVEQLEEWGRRENIEVITKEIGSDSASLAYESYQKAKENDVDVLIVDTAGRLHNNKNLMQELEKIEKVLKKHDESLPHKTLLSLDGTTGQNAISQVEEFQKSIEINGLIITKLDGTAKGGFVLSLADKFSDIPINFIGIGEQIEDLQSFKAKDFAEDLIDI